jgi:hypothetical protein
LTGFDPGALGQGVDQRGGDVRVGVEVEVGQPFGAGEVRLPDQPDAAAGEAFLAFDG